MNDLPTSSAKAPLAKDVLKETQKELVYSQDVNGKEIDSFILSESDGEDTRCTHERSTRTSNADVAEDVDLLRNEINSLREQNENLRSSLERTNSARDEVVEKLKDVSIETRKLIENCEKTTEECKIFKMKNEILEAELQTVKEQNELLSVENEILRDNADGVLRSRNDGVEAIKQDSWQCEVKNANEMLRHVSPLIGNALQELERRNRTIEEMKQELLSLRKRNDDLLRTTKEKDDVLAKRNVDFKDLKKLLGDYQTEMARLDAELEKCRAKVPTLNETPDVVNCQNVDLAEYTDIKSALKKFGVNVKVDLVLSRLRTLNEIEELFDKNARSQPNDFCHEGDNHDEDEKDCDSDKSKTNDVKYRVENLLNAFDKSNEKNILLVNDYENKNRAKSDEIATLKEILHHTNLYTELLEQTLKQSRDNASIDKFVEEKATELIAANKELLETFKGLRGIYHASRRYNNALFADFRRLNLFYKLLKINFDKISGKQSNLRECADLLHLMGELFEEIDEKNARFGKLENESFKIFADYEASVVTKDYLRTAVDAMTLEVKHLTSKVTQEMADKIREIESLRNEMDAIKTDNHELVNKVRNCNRGIISLSSENYDLNEQLEILSKTNENCELLLKGTTGEYKNGGFQIDTIRKIHQQCSILKVENLLTKNDIVAFKEDANAVFGHFVNRLQNANISASNETGKLPVLSVLRDTCRAFRSDKEILKKDTLLARELIFEQIGRVKNDLARLANVSLEGQKDANSKCNLMNLQTVSKDLKRQWREMKDSDFTKPLDDILQLANVTLMNKLNDVVASFETMQRNLNVSVATENRCKNSISSHAASTLKIVQDLKTFHRVFSTFVKAVPIEFSNCIAFLLQNIQETTSATFDHMNESVIRSHEELIKEMQEMNSELKKRGETISVLNKDVDDLLKEKENFRELLEQREKHLDDLQVQVAKYHSEVEERNLLNEALREEMVSLKGELQEKNAKISDMSTVVEKLTAEIRSKEETIAALENEISKNRDIQDGDVSSMGNISRTEEVSRLKDVEDSFEERYLKLRFVAIKMKKTIAELNLQLKTEKTERTAIQCKLNAAIEHAKQNQALRDECDRITDDLELKSKEITELKKIILETDKRNDEMKLGIDNLNKKMESLSKTNDALETDNKELEVKIKNLTSQLKDLEKEKFVEETLKKEKDKETQQLKQKIRENEEFIKKIQINLEQAKLEARKQGALNLEVRDYEKTISDLTERLEERQKAVKELSEKLKIGTESNVLLIERIKQLEEQITSYSISNKAADEQVLNLNLLLSEHEKSLETKDATIKQLTQQLEEEKTKKEATVFQLATIAAEMNTLKQLHHKKEQSAVVELKSSQHKINNLEEKMRNKENELEKLKEDFDSYKIRAHNVLQKHKNENHSKNNEEKLKIEIDNLTKTVKELRKSLDDTIDELHKQKTELQLIEEAKKKLQNRMKEMNEALAEKNKELDSTLAELKSRELNHQTRVKYYENEIDELKATCEKYKTKMDEFTIVKECNNIELNGTFSPITEQNESIKSFEEKNNRHSDAKNDTQGCNMKSENESNTSRKKSRTHSLISLEKLLETDIDEEKKADIAEMEKNIKLLESQVNYLNRILNESEKNAARNEQQAALLKDEIRRLQKTIERAPHLQNGEYLKNVLFNFFTFPDGEEKCRLITILETLLQLTAEETETLSAIAKGYRVEQKRTPGSGLSSMLRLW